MPSQSDLTYARALDSVGHEPNRSSPVILVVDDEAVVRRIVVSALGKQCRVLCAANGAEALRVLTTHRVDAVLTDIVMPEMGGLDLADEVRERYPDIPLAFISAFLDGDTGEEAGRRSRHLISKPFGVAELKAVVRDILDENGIHAPAEPEPQPDSAPAAASEETRAAYRPSMGPEIDRQMALAAAAFQLKRALSAGRTLKITLRDDSMAPALTTGDVVDVVDVDWTLVRPGDLVFIQHGETLGIRRLLGVASARGVHTVRVAADTSRNLPLHLATSQVLGWVRTSADREPMSAAVEMRTVPPAPLAGRLKSWYDNLRLWFNLRMGEPIPFEDWWNGIFEALTDLERWLRQVAASRYRSV